MLSAKYRFHRRNDVNKVYQKGKAIRGNQISLKYRINSSNNEYKIAVVVSKKTAKRAVVRNRIRRRIFEVIRLNSDLIPNGFEAVIGVYSEDVKNYKSEELESEIKKLLSKASL